MRAACSPAAYSLLESRHQLEVGSTSIIGWVSANNQPRIASDINQDPYYQANQTPIGNAFGSRIPMRWEAPSWALWMFKAHRQAPSAPRPLWCCKHWPAQIAVAIRNASLTESIQVNIHELERVYRGSRSIAEAKSETEMTQAVSRILQDSPYAAAMLLVRENRFEAVSTNEREVKHALETALDTLASSVSEIQKFLSGNPIIIEEDTSGLPAALKRFVSQLNHQSVALLPITQDNKLAGLILLGGRKQALTSAIVQPYVGMTDLINAGLDK